MKYSKYHYFLWGILLFCSCSSSQIIGLSDNVSLMPYYKDGYFGYVNSETYEIVIPAQYEHAGAFLGNFAVIQRKPDGKYSVINKNNKTVLRNFHEITLFDSEDGGTVFALAETHWGLEIIKVGDFIPSFIARPSHITYNLYNLNTGMFVLSKIDIFTFKNGTFWPEIKFFANYMTFNEELYEIKNNGAFIEIKTNVKELVTRIARERNLDAKLRFKEEWGLETYYIHIETLDLDLLEQILPENWKVNIRAVLQWRIDHPINGDEVHPLREKEWLYKIELKNEKGEDYDGVYNAFENQWAVPPIKNRTFYDFYQSEYEDWVYYADDERYPDFYNIKTKEKYKYFYGRFSKTTAYMGYHEDKYNNYEVIIEKY